MRVAFLGVGKMGSAMAGCLQRAGIQLHIWNRTPSKASGFAGAGAIVSHSAVEAAHQADLVISSLMDDASVQSVFGGDAGVGHCMKQGAAHVCVTTISPQCADWLAETHARAGNLYVSGPVLGRPDAAAAGQLAQFLAGDEAAMDLVRPVCQIFAPLSIRMEGPARLANLQKLCANFFVIGLVELMAECLTFSEKTGASRDIMTQLLDRSFANPALRDYVQRMAACDFDGSNGFSLYGGRKDLSLMLEAAKSAECPLELAALIQEKMVESLRQGRGDSDWSVIQEVTRQRAGLGNTVCKN